MKSKIKKSLNTKIRLLGFFCLLVLSVSSCKFFEPVDNTEMYLSLYQKIKADEEANKISITDLSLSCSTMKVQVGGIEYIQINAKPRENQSKIKFDVSYDSSVISCNTSSSWGIIVTGLKEGQSNLTVSYDGYDTNCIITVSGYAQNYETTIEPYIYSNTTIMQMTIGATEKINVSLFNGSASDIDGYSWSIVDDSSTISIQPSGQYCGITATAAGYSRIKITHKKAAYPYYIGVYVFDDITKTRYITTTSNILTMNQDSDSTNISVSFVNPYKTTMDSGFEWKIIEENNTDLPVSMEYNGANAVITPIKSGSCTIRVTHPDSQYPLEILCRVISIVKNVYIKPSSTLITLDGDNPQTINCSLEGLKDGEYNTDNYTYQLIGNSNGIAEIVSSIGNQVTVVGRKNGACRLSIAHEKAAYTREVLLISTNQTSEAIYTGCYISTSQNYIKTKEGADSVKVDISLKGAEAGDESSFIWNVVSTATDGSSEKVIDLETTFGTPTFSSSVGRMVNTYSSQSYIFANAIITPKHEGTAVITITHPKAYYSTEILIKVLNKDAILEEPLYFTGEGIIKIVNGESYDYTVELKGANKTEEDNGNIKWATDNSKVSITPSENVAHIEAPPLGTGITKSYITASHSKAEADKKTLLLTADDKETLASIKALYSDKLYYNLEVGSEAYPFVNHVGFDSVDSDNNYINYDFSLLSWTVGDSSIVSVEKDSSNPLSCKIKGLKAGTTKLTASVDGVICDFDVTIYPEGTISTDAEVYFSTSQNVIIISDVDKSVSTTIKAFNMYSWEYSNISWECENTDIATVIGNGTTATITAKKEGETIINVSHPDSQNVLKIYVRIGSAYVQAKVDPVVYISSDDVMLMLKDDSQKLLTAVLVNCNDNDKTGFAFSIDNSNIATITSQSTNGLAYIKPISAGQAEITITHTKSKFEKKVLVVVGNSAEELAGFVYMTTSNNVVAVGEGNTKSISVSIKNSTDVIIDGYTWSSSDPSIIDVTGSGSSAILRGNSIGTCTIKVTNSNCNYPLTIIAQCVNPLTAASSPYIQLTSSVLTLNVGSSFTTITADLVGGDSSDYANFVWNSPSDPTVVSVYGQNEVGKIRALKAGVTYITVSHPKAKADQQLLVVCTEATTSNCSISVPTSIIDMKPTESAKTYEITLVNGDETDKYNFSYSLDVYDIVDFKYSANIISITPKQQGSVTITISHPKATYNQQIVVTVQEYSDFTFPTTNKTITQGNVSFSTMQVPYTKMNTYIEYSVENSDICSITGTKEVAQITAISAGTTTVHAKLISSSTGIVQGSSDMLIYVEAATVNSVYISSSSTILTIDKGKSQTISARLIGTNVTTDDQTNLTWTTNDSDILSIGGISSSGTVKGTSIYLTAKTAGEAILTCSHPLAASDLQFYVYVPGAETKSVSLNKTYMTIKKGSTGNTLKAEIENSDSSQDYVNLIWDAEQVNDKEIVRIMGNGQTVTIYPMNVGETTVTAQLPDSAVIGRCTVKVEADRSFTFETASKTVQPFHTKQVAYKVSPVDATLKWTTSMDGDNFTYSDLGADSNGNGILEISGIKAGTGTITCTTDGSAKGSLKVKVDWDYQFTIDRQSISTTPAKTTDISFNVNPTDAIIKAEAVDDICDLSVVSNYDGTGYIRVAPTSDGKTDINIKVTNPSNNEVFAEAVCNVRFQYSNITIIPEKISSTGNYSHIVTDNEDYNIHIGDGEELRLKLDILEENIGEVVYSSSIIKNGTGESLSLVELGNGKFSITHPTDYIEAAYKINEGYAPTYNGSTTYSNGKKISPSDFKVTNYSAYVEVGTNGQWFFDISKLRVSINNSINGSQYLSYYEEVLGSGGIGNKSNNNLSFGNGWGKTRDTSLDGKIITASSFESSIWYYIPYMHSNTSTHYGEMDTRNINATYLPQSTDTTITGYDTSCYLNIVVTTNNKKYTYQIPITVEKRMCSKTCN